MSELQIENDKTCTLQENVARRIKEISTLPHVAVRVMEVASDPESGAADLKELMETDASLSARVLRCVNSSAYALRSKITNLQQAIAYLGLKQIRNLALTASVSELFFGNETIGPYRRSELWRHLVSVGIGARMISMRLGFEDFEDMFLAGLLHDIGIILEDQYLHEAFYKILSELNEQETLSTAERRHLRFDHTQLGEEIGKLWGFPDAVKAAIRYHHASVNYRGPHIATIRCVEVANLICSRKGISSVGVNLVRLSAPALRGLKLNQRDLPDLGTELDEELKKNSGLFQV